MMFNYMAGGCDYANGMGATLAQPPDPDQDHDHGQRRAVHRPGGRRRPSSELAGTDRRGQQKQLVGTWSTR